MNLSQVLAAYIAAHPAQRIDLTALENHAVDGDPLLVGAPDRRRRMAVAIDELVAGGLVTLPKGNEHWDRKSVPLLPLWLAKPTRQPASSSLPDRVWPRALESAGAMVRSEKDRAVLTRICDWLRDHPHEEPVPITERSIELFGDEKALSLLATNRMFTSGALTLDLLACFPPPLPLAAQHVEGVGPTQLLIAENNATHYSLLAIARSLPPDSRPDLHVAWGRGKEIIRSVDGVRLLDPAPANLWYFGDLDVAGIQIAAAAAISAHVAGLPPLRPASALYRYALDTGEPGPDASNQVPDADRSPMTDWFPPELAPRVTQLLRCGQRIAQEMVGLRQLREHPWLLAEACTL